VQEQQTFQIMTHCSLSIFITNFSNTAEATLYENAGRHFSMKNEDAMVTK